MAEPKKEKVHVELWVYVGRRLGQNSQWRQYYRKLDSAGDVLPEAADGSTTAAFKKLIAPTPYVGSVWRLTWNAEHDTVSGKREYVDRYHDSMLVAQWEAEEAQYETQKALDRRLKEDGKQSELETILKPIAKMMQKTDLAGRRALKMLVLDTLDNLWRGDI